jgi:hypothetical protein
VGGNATAQARIETLMTLADDIIFGATNDGSICQTSIRSADWARLQLERNRAYIVAEIDAWIGSTYTTTVSSADSATDILTCTEPDITDSVLSLFFIVVLIEDVNEFKLPLAVSRLTILAF